MRRAPVFTRLTWCACLAALFTILPTAVRTQEGTRYRLEGRSQRTGSLHERFTDSQLALLEKLNRADSRHLEQLREVVLPEVWADDEMLYSPLPMRYAASEPWSKFLVVYLPGQLFGAYEFGRLVRWGPVSSGGRTSPTGSGIFALNWRSIGRVSTVDPDWFMPWYFNFGNRGGLAFHAYSLPGYPASHGCIRLLERDAQWLFAWGQPWTLDPGGTRVLEPGSPVLIFGKYDFDAEPPWRSLEWISQPVALPALPLS